MLVRRMSRRILAACVLPWLCGGCFSADPPDIHSRHAPQKIVGIKEAVAAGDKSAIPELVHDLDNTDPAVRFYAIQGLEELTGQTFGYLYYQDAPVRRPAVMKWRKWLEENEGKSSPTP